MMIVVALATVRRH